MSHIVEFSVTGLAGRAGEYSRRLNRDVNIFFGLNGSGKTSLLRILHSALEQDASLLAHVPFKSARVVIYSDNYSSEYAYTIENSFEQSITTSSQPHLFDDVELEIEYISDPVFGRRAYQRGPTWKAEQRVPGSGRGWHSVFLPTNRLFQSQSTDPHPQRGVADLQYFDVAFEQNMERRWLDLFGKIQSEVRNTQQQGLADILAEVIGFRESTEEQHLIDWENAYRQTSTFLKRQNTKAAIPRREEFRQRFEQSALLRNVVARIDKVERDIDVTMAPRNKLEELIGRMFTGRKRVTFGPTSIDVLADGSKSIGLRALSSGEKQVLAILMQSIAAARSSFIVDEPEISMHVDWQRELISTIRQLNPYCQMIFATHSPEVMAEVDDKHIFSI